jgi:transcriptional regulator with XRE-family HTH domain
LPFYGFDSLGTYSRIEQKDENITIGQLKQIAAILNVSIIDLLPDELVIANKMAQ